MNLGALDVLPLRASDFASACFTADVPRLYLRLVLVRVIASSPVALIDEGRCRTVALLFDSRHTIPRLAEAVGNAVRSSRTAYGERDVPLGAMLLLTRLSGTISVLDTRSPSASVYEEAVVPTGRLRGAMQAHGGALVAYRRHATLVSRVCVRRAASVLVEQRTARPPRDAELASRYVNGLTRLGVTRPTTKLADDCVCTGTPECACFMWRAVWRAGSTWMIVYVLLPPPTEARATLTPSTASWVERLVDASTSESDDGYDPLANVVPSRWHRAARDYLALMCATSTSALVDKARRLCDVDADDDDESSSASTIDAPDCGSRVSLLVAAVLWACAQPNFRTQLRGIAKRLTMYYKTVLEHVLAPPSRRRLVNRALRAATSALVSAPDDDIILAGMIGSSSPYDAIHRVLPMLVPPPSASLAVCETTGAALVVASALVLCCHEYASHELPRLVNTWSLYESVCPTIKMTT